MFVPLPTPLFKSDVDVLMFQQALLWCLLQCFLLAFHLGETRIVGGDEGNILCEN